MSATDDAITLRAGTAADFDAAARLLAERGDPADAVDFERLVEDPDVGWDHVGVVERHGRIVATASWLDLTIEVGDVVLPAGQIELVATDVAHEGRGYVRSLMDWCHARMAERGQVIQLMIGVPYFYRKFGYEYALPMQAYAEVGELGAVPRDISVRRAMNDDIAVMQRLQRDAQSRNVVRVPRPTEQWRWVVDRDGSAQYVAERDGLVVGTARWTAPEAGRVAMAEVVSDSAATTRSLLHAARNQPDVESVAVMLRAGVPQLSDCCGEPDRVDWYYVRLADVGAVVERLRPVFESRLAASEFAGVDTELLLSWWSGHLRIAVTDGRCGAVSVGGAMQAPVSNGGSGVPPDALGRLMFSDGATGVEQRYPDCFLGQQRDLMAVLFPPVTSDVLSWYLP